MEEMKMNSYMVRQFKNSIIGTANAYDLPIEVKRLCMAEVMAELNALAEQQIQSEIRQEQDRQRAQEAEQEEADDQSI